MTKKSLVEIKEIIENHFATVQKNYELVDFEVCENERIFVLAKSEFETVSWRCYISTENNLCKDSGMYHFDKINGFKAYAERVKEWREY